MENATQVLEYKCPCCNAGLMFSGKIQQLKCEYCDNSFDLEAVKAYNDITEDYNELQWDESKVSHWSDEESLNVQSFSCPSCGGELLTDATTAATFCPFCDNPTILPSRLTEGLKPSAVIPFKTTKENAKEAFRSLCKGKPLLPSLFLQDSHIEKITGMYVPFWLYDCEGTLDGSYKATRVHHWSDSKYHYTKTDHFLLKRSADAAFSGIPMDGSSKMDDTFMESIEPYDYADITDFTTTYLTGFYADKYDIPSEAGEDRIRQRVSNAFDDQLQSTFLGYASVIPTARNLNIRHSKSKYVLLPVWIMNTNYQGKTYTFAMNGQTGKMTGSFPVCRKKAAAWFAGIFIAVTAFTSLLQLIIL